MNASDTFILVLISAVVGAIVISGLVIFEVPEIVCDFIKELNPVSDKSEMTATGNLVDVVVNASCVFALIAIPTGAVIGSIVSWQHLSWIPATFISIALGSLVAGIAISVFSD